MAREIKLLPREFVAAALCVLALIIAHAFPSKAYPGLALLYGIILLLTALWGGIVCHVARTPIQISALLLALACLVWPFFGMIRMPVPAAASDTLARLFVGFAAFVGGLVWATIARRNQRDSNGQALVRFFVIAITFILLGLSIHAIWQRFFGYELSLKRMRDDPAAFGEDIILREAIMHALRMKAPGSTFGDQNTLAALSAVGIAMFAGWAAAMPSIRVFMMAGVGAAVCAFAVVLTQSRGGALTAMLALVGGLALWADVFRRRGLSPDRMRQLMISMLAVIVVGMAVLIVVLSASTLGSEWRRRLAAVSTGTQRIYYAQSALSMWHQQPLIGQGPGAFPLLYPQHRVAGSGETSDPHNWVLRMLAEQGVIGLGLLIAWLAVSAGIIWRGRTPLTLACGLGVVLLLFNGLLQHSFSTREVYLDFCLLLGLAVGGAQYQPNRRIVIDRTVLALSLLCLALLAWPLWMKADYVRYLLDQSKSSLAASASLQQHGNDALAFHYARLGKAEAEKAMRLDPRNPWIYDFLAQVLFYTPNLRDEEQAIVLEKKAIELNPLSASFHDNLALMYQEQGRYPAAFEEWERALALHPLDEVIYSHRAKAFEQTGQLERAVEDAYRAVKLTLRSKDRYIRDYEALVEKAGHRAKEDVSNGLQ